MTPTPLAINSHTPATLPPADFPAADALPAPASPAVAQMPPSITSLVSSALPSLHQLHWCLSKAESSLPRGATPACLEPHRERELTRALLTTASLLDAQCVRLVRQSGRSVIRVRIDDRESDLAACSTRLMAAFQEAMLRSVGAAPTAGGLRFEAQLPAPHELAWPQEADIDVDDDLPGAPPVAAPDAESGATDNQVSDIRVHGRRTWSGQLPVAAVRRSRPFLVSAVPLGQDGLCLRIDAPAVPGALRTLEQLGFLPDDIARIDRAVATQGALVVVGGPARSGRTSTLQAALARIDPRARSIQTLEPVPALPVPGWLQMTTPAAQAAQALAVLGGNLADAVLADYPLPEADLTPLLKLSLAGCSVFSPMWLDRAHHALGLRPEFSRRLSLVVAQRLVRRLCPQCARPDHSPEVRHALARAANTWLHGQALNPASANPRGCANCRGTGYHGRALVYEVLEVDAPVRTMIEEGAPHAILEQRLQSEGRSLWDHGIRLLAAGQISLDSLRESICES